MGYGNILNLKEPIDSRDGKLTLMALLMMLYVIALFFSIAVHEVLGHGLFTVLLGGDFYAFYLAPGSGYASLWLPQTMSHTDIGLVYMAGILVQLVIGTFTLLLVLPRIKTFIPKLFTLMFCVCMLVHSSLYLVMGYYYDAGDTKYAVTVLGIQPDLFMVAGIILTGTFVLLLSSAALKSMGEYMDLDDDKVRSWTLLLFWSPSLVLNGLLAFAYSLSLPRDELAYPFINSALLLLFIGVALALVPMFSEPLKKKDYSISMKSVFSVVLCFALLLAGWAGIFGLSRETAHGVLIHDPPIQTEVYYSDYSIGNAEFTVFTNGTVRADIILRNYMDAPSPLDNRIYHSFDNRPDWDRYVARSRNIMITMFDLPRSVGENLSFSTDFGIARAKGVEDELGRKCTTYLRMDDAGTRQYYVSPGEQTYQPGMGITISDYTLRFADPWFSQRRYLDEVRVTWESGLEEVEILAWNDLNTDISYNRGNILDNTIGWKNINYEGSPSDYKITFKII
ncbi:MAG: hypothetical protein KKH41_03010 [Candidatus Thermoplasmatota archaeon]|nr:hypothetical protein [Euryarchaeota archaeon]MBU4031685.1 hypothetical protein [Candidatus Thermoplasmatota archaeon]MBU4070738.1 hypothetical protein [Candidatus Thermoplasmatota archaeon]MBU4145166.1 hypothetical protein [Candidatus Thermoplasmatota archaeon]MBU4591534.1 hypothetical protein [Candidatus Thermoplasmatota archaeon]